MSSIFCKPCLKSFPSFNALLVLTAWAHTSGQRDVRDFLINLGKRSRHLPWASVSESIVERAGRKQMMAPWPHGALDSARVWFNLTGDEMQISCKQTAQNWRAYLFLKRCILHEYQILPPYLQYIISIQEKNAFYLLKTAWEIRHKNLCYSESVFPNTFGLLYF